MWPLLTALEEKENAGTILPTIQARGIPEALKLDSNQTMGADWYRLNLLKAFKTKGAADVENFLKQNQELPITITGLCLRSLEMDN